MAIEQARETTASATPDPVDTPPRPRPRLELRCAECGYGAVTAAERIRCPMCGGEDWDFAEWRPFSA
jgi:rubrerythrin